MRRSFVRFYLLNSVLLAGITLFGVSCKKDEPPSTISGASSVGSRSIYIGCEGNFQFGNTSISKYDPDSFVVVQEWFKKQNSGMQLGDVLQSIHEHEDYFYLVINNSGKIIVVDRFSFEYKGEISGFNSPREMAFVGGGKALVSDLYANKVYLVDLYNRVIEKEFSTSGWTEEMLVRYGMVFICNRGGNMLYKYNAETELMEDSVSLGVAPAEIELDKDGKLWVLTGGKIEVDGVSQLFQVEPSDLSILKTFNFTLGTRAHDLCINEAADSLYFLKKDLFGMSVGDVELPSVPILKLDANSLYGLFYDKKDKAFYVSDAQDYVQGSLVYRFTGNLMPVDTFTVGINASSFIKN